MIKKKIKRLQNRNYKIDEAAVSISINIFNSKNQIVNAYTDEYFIHTRRKRRQPYIKKITKDIQNKLLAETSKYTIESITTIFLSIYTDRLKNLSTFDDLIRKLAKDTRESFNIDHKIKETINIKLYSTEIIFNISPNYTIKIKVPHDNLRKPYYMYNAEIALIKSKTLHSYF